MCLQRPRRWPDQANSPAFLVFPRILPDICPVGAYFAPCSGGFSFGQKVVGQMVTNAVQLEKVTKTFGAATAVSDLDLQIPCGSIYGFIGPNGSGKTTTIRMILRIFYPDSGRIEVLGQDRGDCADERLGYLPEERGLYRRMRVRDLLRYYAKLKGFRNCDDEISWWLVSCSLRAQA